MTIGDTLSENIAKWKSSDKYVLYHRLSTVY